MRTQIDENYDPIISLDEMAGRKLVQEDIYDKINE